MAQARMNPPDRQVPQGSPASVPRLWQAVGDKRYTRPHAARSAAVTTISAPSAHRTWRPARKTSTVTARTNAGPLAATPRRERMRAVRQHSGVQGQRRRRFQGAPESTARASRETAASSSGDRDQILQRDRGENRERKLHENDVSAGARKHWSTGSTRAAGRPPYRPRARSSVTAAKPVTAAISLPTAGNASRRIHTQTRATRQDGAGVNPELVEPKGSTLLQAPASKT